MHVLTPKPCDLEKDCGFKKLPQAAYTNALIAPDGTFYRVHKCGHSHAAAVHGNTDVDTLEREGWIHFSLVYEYRPVVNRDVHITQAQFDVLFDILMCAERGEYNPEDFERTEVAVDNHKRILKTVIAEGHA